MSSCYQAITTKYLGPTNVRGSRIKAKAAAGSITIHYDDSLNSQQAHAKAAKALAEKLGWEGAYYQGGLPDDCGYCFVHIGKASDDYVPAFYVEAQ
jgi:hypothetical protein